MAPVKWFNREFVGGVWHGQQRAIQGGVRTIRAPRKIAPVAVWQDGPPELNSFEFEIDTYCLKRLCRRGNQSPNAVWYCDAYWGVFVLDNMSERQALSAVMDVCLPVLYWDRTDEAKIELYGFVLPSPTGVGNLQ